MEIPFIGGSYEGKSKNLNAQVCQNLYPVVDQQGGKSVLGLYNVPGTTSYINLGEGNRYLVKLGSVLNFTAKGIIMPPNPNALWAWFKLNEGTGYSIIDYSPVAVNGTVGINPPISPTAAEIAQFWALNPGFGTGYTRILYYNSAHARRSTPSRNTAYCSLVAFFKPISYGYPWGAGFVQLGETASLNYIGIAYLNGSPYNLILTVSNGVSATSAYTLTLGTWYCIYAYSQASVNNNGLYVRKSGDSDWTQALLDIGTTNNAGSNQNLITFLGAHNNGINVEGGDVLYYAHTSPSGIINLTQATEIYDQLKPRYGMI